jgi:hypothetical protein
LAHRIYEIWYRFWYHGRINTLTICSRNMASTLILNERDSHITTYGKVTHLLVRNSVSKFSVMLPVHRNLQKGRKKNSCYTVWTATVTSKILGRVLFSFQFRMAISPPADLHTAVPHWTYLLTYLITYLLTHLLAYLLNHLLTYLLYYLLT